MTKLIFFGAKLVVFDKYKNFLWFWKAIELPKWKRNCQRVYNHKFLNSFMQVNNFGWFFVVVVMRQACIGVQGEDAFKLFSLA